MCVLYIRNVKIFIWNYLLYKTFSIFIHRRNRRNTGIKPCSILISFLYNILNESIWSHKLKKEIIITEG